jgi:hypothetical protein
MVVMVHASLPVNLRAGVGLVAVTMARKELQHNLFAIRPSSQRPAGKLLT